jgi:hypothetical protein
METKTDFINPLIERIEGYGNTTVELIKLKTVEKTAEISSTVISRLLILIAVSAFILTINIAIALWLGDVLGKNYYGFLVIAAFYAIISLVLCVVHSSIKSRINNSIIKQLLN